MRDNILGLLLCSLSKGPQKGPENGCRAKIVEKCRKYLWHFLKIFDFFCPARKLSKSVEKIFDTFWRFLTFFDVAPFHWPLLRSADLSPTVPRSDSHGQPTSKTQTTCLCCENDCHEQQTQTRREAWMGFSGWGLILQEPARSKGKSRYTRIKLLVSHLPPPPCREVSHQNLGLKRCRATRGCRSYSCGCRATLCN